MMITEKQFFYYFESNESEQNSFPFLPMTIGRFPHQNSVVRPFGYEFHQFLWVTNGEGIFEIDGNPFSLQQGKGVFLRKEVPHSYYGTDTFSTAWVSFLSGETLLSYYGMKDRFVFETSDFLEHSADQLASSCLSTDSTALRVAYGYLWAAELLHAIFQKPTRWSETIDRFLEQNYHLPLTLDDIACFGKIDKYVLCKRYLKETGSTIMQTLKQIRITRAKRFLRYSSFSVEEIGKQCGYENPSYFIKIFRETVGCTPLQYKKKP